MLCYAPLGFVENDRSCITLSKRAISELLFKNEFWYWFKNQEYKPCSNQDRFAMMDRKNINDEYANVKRFPFAAVISEKTKLRGKTCQIIAKKTACSWLES